MAFVVPSKMRICKELMEATVAGNRLHIKWEEAQIYQCDLDFRVNCKVTKVESNTPLLKENFIFATSKPCVSD